MLLLSLSISSQLSVLLELCVSRCYIMAQQMNNIPASGETLLWIYAAASVDDALNFGELFMPKKDNRRPPEDC